MSSNDFEDECRQGCLHSLYCLVLKRKLRSLHLVSKKFYRKHCSCDLKLVAISFNHDSASLNADAMNVRKNFATAISAPNGLSARLWRPTPRPLTRLRRPRATR